MPLSIYFFVILSDNLNIHYLSKYCTYYFGYILVVIYGYKQFKKIIYHFFYFYIYFFRRNNLIFLIVYLFIFFTKLTWICTGQLFKLL